MVKAHNIPRSLLGAPTDCRVLTDYLIFPFGDPRVPQMPYVQDKTYDHLISKPIFVSLYSN